MCLQLLVKFLSVLLAQAANFILPKGDQNMGPSKGVNW